MNRFSDTRYLFAQLAAIPAEGAVKTLIENHDAWNHGAAAYSTLSAALRARIAFAPRSPVVQARIAVQRRALRPLLTRLPVALAPAC